MKKTRKIPPPFSVSPLYELVCICTHTNMQVSVRFPGEKSGNTGSVANKVNPGSLQHSSFTETLKRANDPQTLPLLLPYFLPQDTKNKLHIRHSCKMAWDDPRNEYLGISRWTFLCQRWHQAGTPKLVLWRTESARNGWRPTGGKWKVLWPVCHLFPLGNKDMTQLHVVCKRPPPSTSAVTVWRGMDRKGRRKESPHSPESHHSLKQEQLSFHSHCLEHSRRLWLRARCVAGLEMLWTGISWL